MFESKSERTLTYDRGCEDANVPMPSLFRLPSACFAQVVSEDCVYSEVYLCTACGAFLGIHHRYISALVVNNFCFVFSRYSHCVSCGSGAVDRGGRLYFPSINPLAWIQVLAAAPLRECSPCAPSYSAGSFRSCPGARRARIRTAPSHCPRAVRS
jgi:hypothetical protein